MIIQFLWNSKGPARILFGPSGVQGLSPPFSSLRFHWPLFSLIMRPPSYRQRLFVEYYLGESSRPAVDACAELGTAPLPGRGQHAGAATGIEKSEKRGVQAARNAPSEDRKCWQLLELGIHGLRSWGRNWSRKSPRNTEFRRPSRSRRRKGPPTFERPRSVVGPQRSLGHCSPAPRHAPCRRPEIGFVLPARFRLYSF